MSTVYEGESMSEAVHENSNGGGPVQQLSLVELSTQAIRRRILTGELPAGSKLREEHLREELGVSRPPLREALRILEQEGLVVKVPRVGAQVVSLTRHDYWELLTLRHALETLAFQLALPVKEPDRLQTCRDALAAMEECARDNSAAGMVDAGYRFHLSLVRLADHGRIVDVYESLQAQLKLCMALNTTTGDESLDHNVQRHRDLFAPIEAGDVERALAALRAHGEGRFLDVAPHP